MWLKLLGHCVPENLKQRCPLDEDDAWFITPTRRREVG